MGRIRIKTTSIQLFFPLEEHVAPPVAEETPPRVISILGFKKTKDQSALTSQKREIAERLAQSAKQIEWLYTTEDLKEG